MFNRKLKEEIECLKVKLKISESNVISLEAELNKMHQKVFDFHNPDSITAKIAITQAKIDAYRVNTDVLSDPASINRFASLCADLVALQFRQLNIDSQDAN